MFNRNIIVTVVLAVMLVLPYGLAAISQGALLFLTFEPGGRASGMGRAYSAIADDAYAPWWNPGATAFNRKTQLAGTHIPWLQGGGAGFDDIFYEYLGWNQYFEGIGNINVYLTLLDAGTQPQMDEFGNHLGDFHSFDFAASAGYSYDLIPNTLGLGGNFKMMYSYLGPGTGNTEDDGSAIAFAFDVGAKYKNLGIPNLDASLVIQNVGPNVTFIDQAQSDPLPMTVRAGLAYKVMDIPMVGRLLFSAEASKVLANEDPLLMRFITGWKHMDETIFSAGAEYTYLDLLSLRGGYFVDNAGSVVGPSFGAGLQYLIDKKYLITADFAMIVGGDLVDYNKIFSVGFEF